MLQVILYVVWIKLCFSVCRVLSYIVCLCVHLNDKLVQMTHWQSSYARLFPSAQLFSFNAWRHACWRHRLSRLHMGMTQLTYLFLLSAQCYEYKITWVSVRPCVRPTYLKLSFFHFPFRFSIPLPSISPSLYLPFPFSFLFLFLFFFFYTFPVFLPRLLSFFLPFRFPPPSSFSFYFSIFLSVSTSVRPIFKAPYLRKGAR